MTEHPNDTAAAIDRLASAITTNGATMGGPPPGLGEMIAAALAGGASWQDESVTGALCLVAEALQNIAEAIDGLGGDR